MSGQNSIDAALHDVNTPPGPIVLAFFLVMQAHLSTVSKLIRHLPPIARYFAQAIFLFFEHANLLFDIAQLVGRMTIRVWRRRRHDAVIF